VDAAIRQLLHEGWMHNRGRLLAASYLAKTLYMDWRIGTRHFPDLLVDGDIAGNQLNWQWMAGTGTGTRPNRVLDPLAQAMRFDPHGDYVRQWVPELAHLPGAAVHQPWKLDGLDRARLDYPDPLVDQAEGRARFERAGWRRTRLPEPFLVGQGGSCRRRRRELLAAARRDGCVEPDRGAA
jgi:deoxyribodipyrimidine photo-lyase